MSRYTVISLYTAKENGYFSPFTISTVQKMTNKAGRPELLSALPDNLCRKLKAFYEDLDAYDAEVLPDAVDLRQKVLEIITKHRGTLLLVEKQLADAQAALRARNAAIKKAAKISVQRAQAVVLRQTADDFNTEIQRAKQALAQQPPNVLEAQQSLQQMEWLVKKYLE